MSDLNEMLGWIESVKGRTRLSETQLLIIFGMRKENRSYKYIGDEIGVSSQAISYLLNDKYIKAKAYHNKYYQKLKDDPDKFQSIKGYSKERYEKHKQDKDFKETRKKHAVINNGKLKLKKILVNSIHKEPTKNLKQVWDGLGKWSRKYDECLECCSNLFKHQAQGLCARCYRQIHKESNESNKARAAAYYKKNKKKVNEKLKVRYSKVKKIYEKALSGEIKVEGKAERILNEIQSLVSRPKQSIVSRDNV